MDERYAVITIFAELAASTGRAERPGVANDHAMVRIYHRLLGIARSRLAADPMGSVVGTASLVHETVLRLMKQRSLEDADELRLIAAASHLMGQTLVDLARHRRAQKRNGGVEAVSLRSADIWGHTVMVDAVEFGDAIGALRAAYPDSASVVEMRFWGDMTLDEIARVRGTTRRQVSLQWNHAKAWLARELAGDGAGP